MPKKKEPKPKKPKKKAQPGASTTFHKMVAAWLYYEGAGTVLHDSYQNLDLTLVPGTGAWTVGVEGRAFDPDASGYAYHADDPRLDVGANQDFTIVMGLQMPDGLPAVERAFFGKRPTNILGTFYEGYTAHITLLGQVVLGVEEVGGAGTNLSTTGAHQCDGQFHVWALGREGSELFIIKDGIEKWTTVGPTGDLSNWDEFYIGYHDYYGVPYDDPIYFVYFYRGRALGPQEVKSIKTAPFVGFSSPPVLQGLIGGGGAGGQPQNPTVGAASGYAVGGGLFVG